MSERRAPRVAFAARRKRSATRSKRRCVALLRSGAHLAETEEEKRAVYRFRYDIYVEEMGRYQDIADHENRMFMEPEDATARTFYVAEDGEVLATSRMSWGG